MKKRTSPSEKKREKKEECPGLQSADGTTRPSRSDGRQETSSCSTLLSVHTPHRHARREGELVRRIPHGPRQTETGHAQHEIQKSREIRRERERKEGPNREDTLGRCTD